MKTKKTFLGIVFSISLSLCLIPTAVLAGDEQPEPNNLEELKIAVAGILETHKVPAVGIVMADKSGPVWVGALGRADLAKDIDANADTMFRIGSTSKMFVALAVLKLVEEGKLSLDDKLSDLAPEIGYQNQWSETDPVRIVHLLEHTTGWDDLHLTEYAHNDPTPATLKQGLDFHPHSRISRWKPGSRYAYCNSGPPVAAYIVEKITGQDFEAYITENFFGPMGMETMSYLLTSDVEQRGATLYSNGDKPEDYWHIIMRPSGSINASAKDMLKFLELYLQRGAVDGKQLVSEASLARMETALSTPAAAAGLQIGYGMHNYSSTHEQWVYRAHNGGVNGGLTELAYLPEAGFGHVIMINSGNGAAFKELSELIRNFETRNLPSREIRPGVAVTDLHRQIEGLYYPINSRQKVAYFMERVLNVRKLWFDGDRLASKDLFDEETSYYIPVGDAQYMSAKTGRVSLIQTIDPLAGKVISTGNGVFTPSSAIAVYGSLAVAILWGILIASSLLFFLVWIVRKLRGKITSGAAIKVRIWPLLASVSVVGVLGLFTYGFIDPFKLLGKPTAVSLGIMFLSITFALFAMMGVLTSIRERRSDMNKIAYWHSSVTSITHLVVSAYLLWFGIIGLRVWA